MSDSRKSTVLGTSYCVLSAFGYVAFYICLRKGAEKQDPMWVNCVQASVGAAVFGVYLAYKAIRGQRVLPPLNELLALLAIGLVTQVGSVLMIWAINVVGVGITSTLQMGVMLAAGAVLGRIVLAEKVSWLQTVAIALVTLAVVFFSTGAQSAGESVPAAVGPLRVLLGIAAGVACGLAFAVLTVGVRKTVTSTTSPEAVVFLINVMGTVVFGPLCVYLMGLDSLLHTPQKEFGAMVAAGAMNLVGFLFVTISLKMIPVVHVNVINNGLVSVLTVLAGIRLFGEPWNRDIAIGIALCMAGTLLISLVAPPEEAADKNEELARDNPPS
jgi:drug/metabolite transporter (DMT)-like permease